VFRFHSVAAPGGRGYIRAARRPFGAHHRGRGGREGLNLFVLRNFIEELFTIGVGLIHLDGKYVKQWGKIMAAFFVASIPLIIIFLFTMKLFIRGLSSGAAAVENSAKPRFRVRVKPQALLALVIKSLL
jgi:hypothetical protein